MSLHVLFNSDDLVVDTEKKLIGDISDIIGRKISSEEIRSSNPEIKEAMCRIRSQVGWWENLPRNEEGIAIYEEINKIPGVCLEAIFVAPSNFPMAFTERTNWYLKNLSKASKYTITTYLGGMPTADFFISSKREIIGQWLQKNQTRKAAIVNPDMNLESKNPEYPARKLGLLYYLPNELSLLKEMFTQAGNIETDMSEIIYVHSKHQTKYPL